MISTGSEDSTEELKVEVSSESELRPARDGSEGGEDEDMDHAEDEEGEDGG